MKRASTTALSLMLIVAFATVLVGHLRPTDHVYTVADVQIGLHRDPHAWIGRIVLIRGRDEQQGLACADSTRTVIDSHGTKRDVQQVACYATPNSRDMLFGLPDPWAHPPQGVTNGPLAGVTTGPLVLVRDDGAHVPPLHAPDHVAVLLAQLPIVGRLVPLSLLERGAVYRVRLVNAAHCNLPPCPQGLLQ